MSLQNNGSVSEELFDECVNCDWYERAVGYGCVLMLKEKEWESKCPMIQKDRVADRKSGEER